MAKSSTVSTYINLTKSLISSALVSLPFAYFKGGIILATALLIFFSFLSALSMVLIGVVCDRFLAKFPDKQNDLSFKLLWGFAIGKGAWIIDSFIFINGIISIVAYQLLIGDFIQAAFSLFFEHNFWISKAFFIIVASVLFLFPLCSMKSLSLLKYTSFLGVMAASYLFSFVLVDSIRNRQPGTQLNYWPHDVPGVMKTVGLFNAAFICHFNGPSYYKELSNVTVKRYSSICICAFITVTLFFLIFSLAGYIRFGQEIEGNILCGNYRAHGGNVFVMIANIAMGLNILCSYPLVFISIRKAFAGMFNIEEERVSFRLAFSLIFVGFSAVLGAFLKDVAIVNGIKGATTCSALIFVFPFLLYLNLPREKPLYNFRKVSLYTIIVFGVVVGVCALLAVFISKKKK